MDLKWLREVWGGNWFAFESHGSAKWVFGDFSKERAISRIDDLDILEASSIVKVNETDVAAVAVSPDPSLDGNCFEFCQLIDWHSV